MAASYRMGGLALLFCLLLCAGSCRKQDNEPAREDYTIQGHVQNLANGSMIAGVHITVTATDRSDSTRTITQDAGSVTTDATGSFSIQPYHVPVVTTYDFLLQKDGFYDHRDQIPANYFSGTTHPGSYTVLFTMQPK